jgi:hypothetical protein
MHNLPLAPNAPELRAQLLIPIPTNVQKCHRGVRYDGNIVRHSNLLFRRLKYVRMVNPESICVAQE